NNNNMRKINIGKIAKVAAVVAMFTAATANAAMVIYSGTTPLQGSASNPYTDGVVGTIGGTTGQGQGGWGSFQQGAGQALLNLAQSGTGTYLGEALYANTADDYSGTVDAAGASLSGGANNTTVPAGWEFAIAKYDGQNAGYVLFYLGGTSETLPTSPDN